MSEVVDQLPSCIALQSKSNGKFLRYVQEHGAEHYRQLQLNGEDALNPFTRFDVEPSRLHHGLVHIRCRYNRKYWRAARDQQVDGGGGWVVLADADEPEEDLSKPSCTLIKVVPPAVSSDDDASRAAEAGVITDDEHPRESAITFRFVMAGRLQAVGKDDDGGTRMLLSGTGSVGSCLWVGRGGSQGDERQQQAGYDSFIIFDVSNSSRLLPRHVAFKGSNGKYLTVRVIQGRTHLAFASDDIGDANVAHEMLSTSNGTSYRVRNNGRFMLWRRDNNTNWILADGNANQNIFDINFQVIQVGDLFALRSSRWTGNRRVPVFCINQTAPGNSNFLNCLEGSAATLPREALVQVEEAVMHRDISDIDYNLGEARVYDRKALTMAKSSAVNDTSTPNTKRLTISFEETETAQWDSTHEITIGYKATMKVGFPKLGLGAQAELSAEYFGSYNWGETVVTTVKKVVEYEVTVPPRTTVTVRVIATKASCDVPFTYTQRDTLTDGTVSTRSEQGGIFTGVNSYNFKFETTETPLEERLIMASS